MRGKSKQNIQSNTSPNSSLCFRITEVLKQHLLCPLHPPRPPLLGPLCSLIAAVGAVTSFCCRCAVSQQSPNYRESAAASRQATSHLVIGQLGTHLRPQTEISQA